MLKRLLALPGLSVLLLPACVAQPPVAVPEWCDELNKATLQLQWFTQAQFAGYFAARDNGYYLDECLDVTIYEGGVEIVPIAVMISGGADFAVSWVPRALVPLEEGSNVVNIAQIFERSGTVQVVWADSGIRRVEDLKGKIIGNWGYGNDFEQRAGLRHVGIDLEKDVTLVQQNFDMAAFLNREIDAAQAMIYNEYAQVLEAVNPDTGLRYRPEDMVVLNWSEVGTSMLQDSIWADAERLEEEPGFRETSVRFLKASLRGWIWCRDFPAECVDIVLENAPTLGRSHQAWQLNEVNALIWPSTMGIGVMLEELWERTTIVSVVERILDFLPPENAYRTDIAAEAVARLEEDGYDVFGASWERLVVELTEGGE